MESGGLRIPLSSESSFSAVFVRLLKTVHLQHHKLINKAEYIAHGTHKQYKYERIQKNHPWQSCRRTDQANIDWIMARTRTQTGVIEKKSYTYGTIRLIGTSIPSSAGSRRRSKGGRSGGSGKSKSKEGDGERRKRSNGTRREQPGSDVTARDHWWPSVVFGEREEEGLRYITMERSFQYKILTQLSQRDRESRENGDQVGKVTRRASEKPARGRSARGNPAGGGTY